VPRLNAVKRIPPVKRWRRALKLWCVGSGVWLVFALSGVVWTLATNDYARSALFDRHSVFPVLVATGVDVLGPPFIALAFLTAILVIADLTQLAYTRVNKFRKVRSTILSTKNKN
jgi:hypothetical protein